MKQKNRIVFYIQLKSRDARMRKHMHLDKDRDTCVSHSTGFELISNYPRNAKCFWRNLIRIRTKIKPSETSLKAPNNLIGISRNYDELSQFVKGDTWNSIWRHVSTYLRSTKLFLRTLPASGRARRCPNRCATRSSAARQSRRGG